MKGADFIASMVFMFASTNLVIELGIVLVVLMGWQFAVSEFVGGGIMIVLLATLGALWLRGRLVVQARERLQASEDDPEHQHGSAADEQAGQLPLRVRLKSVAGWADSATYTMSDLTMVRRELVIGYTVAGFLAVLVPTSVWQAVFITGHGFWTSVENAIVGPFIAIISFVCSIGNVPAGGGPVEGGHLLRRCHRVHLRRPDRVPAPSDLPPLLRDAVDAPDARGVLGPHVHRRTPHRVDLPCGRLGAHRAADHRWPRRTSPGTTPPI